MKTQNEYILLIGIVAFIIAACCFFVYLLSPKVIYVAKYGLVADGVTDDSAAIQRAFDDADNGSIVQFPSDVVIKMSGVVINKEMHIYGNGATFIIQNGCTAFHLKHYGYGSFRDITTYGAGVALKTN